MIFPLLALGAIGAVLFSRKPVPFLRDKHMTDQQWEDVFVLTLEGTWPDMLFACKALEQKGFPLAAQYVLNAANRQRAKTGLPALSYPLPPL